MRRIIALVFPLLACVSAIAQPAPPAPPAGVINLGDVGVPQTLNSPDVPLGPGGIVWFQFNLTTPITRLGNWLELDTSGSNISDNMMVIYSQWAFRAGDDNDSGGGASGRAAAMSFGAGSGERLSREAGGRISNGAWGLRNPGIYYVGIIGWINNFNGWSNPNRTWDYNTNSTIAGTIRLTIRTGQAPSTFWNERHHEGGNSSTLPMHAMTVEGNGPLQTLLCDFPTGERETFKIRICDPAIFRATAKLSFWGGGTYRARMFLFDEDGRGVVGINNTIEGTDTTLTGLPSITPGDYFLTVGSYCGGANGYNAVPYDAANQPLWDFSNNHNVSIAPNGPGAANPILFLGSQSNCENVADGDVYTARIEMTGACHVASAPSGCPDLNGDGVVSLQDLAILLAVFGTVCP